MFFTFLNKDNPYYLDLSVMIKYNPDEVLFYFYNSFIKIPWESYLNIKGLIDSSDKPESPLQKWLHIFDQEIEAEQDLTSLKDNFFIQSCGPYYYLPSNTRFYFTKEPCNSSELLNSEDLALIIALISNPPVNKELQTYYKRKKAGKKSARNKDELIRDINICLACLKETEKLNQHINCLQKLLEHRQQLLTEDELFPAEPDNIPVKPQKPEESGKLFNNIIPFSLIKSRQLKQHVKDCNNYNHDNKVYLIRYREYEKACTRYKASLEKWSSAYESFKEGCSRDLEKCQEQLKRGQENLKMYNSIMQKSVIHSQYQDIETLELFKYYLNTGRAFGLQDCMNLFEEERHWMEIKASQERIENTIFYLQNDNPDLKYAEEHLEYLLENISAHKQSAAVSLNDKA